MSPSKPPRSPCHDSCYSKASHRSTLDAGGPHQNKVDPGGDVYQFLLLTMKYTAIKCMKMICRMCLQIIYESWMLLLEIMDTCKFEAPLDLTPCTRLYFCDSNLIPGRRWIVNRSVRSGIFLVNQELQSANISYQCTCLVHRVQTAGFENKMMEFSAGSQIMPNYK